MSEIKVACFDVDGHLADTIPALTRNHEQLYRDLYNDTPPTDAFIKSVGSLVGRSAEEVFRSLYPGRFMGLGLQDQDEEMARLMAAFGDLAGNDPRPAQPIRDVPRELRRLHAGLDAAYLVTNRRIKTLPRALGAAGIDPALFDEEHTYAAERVRALGGKAGALEEIKRLSGLTREQMSMSGDDFKDVQAALDADVRAFFVPRPDLSRGERQRQMRAVEQAGHGEVGVFRTFRELGRTALLPVT
jgi:phosphoglycolate phosphatase-like HAD superfamily hydrolase